MPHLVLEGELDWEEVARNAEPRLERSGRSVIKIEEWWRKTSADALLANGVVVEFARPLHPVATVVPRDGETVVRLWPLAPVERTAAVQRWLGLVAAELQRCGAGAVRTSNIPDQALAGLSLRRSREGSSG